MSAPTSASCIVVIKNNTSNYCVKGSGKNPQRIAMRTERPDRAEVGGDRGCQAEWAARPHPGGRVLGVPSEGGDRGLAFPAARGAVGGAWDNRVWEAATRLEGAGRCCDSPRRRGLVPLGPRCWKPSLTRPEPWPLSSGPGAAHLQSLRPGFYKTDLLTMIHIT